MAGIDWNYLGEITKSPGPFKEGTMWFFGSRPQEFLIPEQTLMDRC